MKTNGYNQPICYIPESMSSKKFYHIKKIKEIV